MNWEHTNEQLEEEENFEEGQGQGEGGRGFWEFEEPSDGDFSDYADYLTANDQTYEWLRGHFSTHGGPALPDVPPVFVEEGGSAEAHGGDRGESLPLDSVVRYRNGEARGRKRPPPCLPETLEWMEQQGPDELGLEAGEAVARQLPVGAQPGGGEEVLPEGGRLHTKRRRIDFATGGSDSMEESEGDGGDWRLEGSPGGFGRWERKSAQRPDSVQPFNIFEPAVYGASSTASEGGGLGLLRRPLFVGQGEAHPGALWRDQQGEDDTRRVASTVVSLDSPFRPPRRVEAGLPRGLYLGRHELFSSARRGSDRPTGHREGLAGPRSLPSRSHTGWDAEDHYDEQDPLRDLEPGEPGY